MEGKFISESPSRAIFQIAYRRIWQGWFLRDSPNIVWSVLAAYRGMAIHYLVPEFIKNYTGSGDKGLGFWGVTPLAIGFATYRAHFTGKGRYGA